MKLKSAIYIGRVRHRRRSPRHAFSMPLFMVYLDLAEIDRVLSLTRFWGRSRLCPARFRRDDYLKRGGLSLEDSVRSAVEEATGHRPTGPIRMLTNLRYFGYNFNPVTFYYCFDGEEQVESIVAEITNTPWRERHAYALAAASARNSGGILRWRFGKEFHVSPFFPMNLEYDWSFTTPRDELLIHMNVRDYRDSTARVFDATLRMVRHECTPRVLRWVLLRFPLMTARVIARIHFEALRLWLKRARVFAHPKKHLATVPGGHA